MIELIGGRLFQWDVDRQIKINTSEPNIEIHFAHYGDAKALVVKMVENDGYFGANIPNILLQRSGRLNVYVVSNDVTLERFRFQVVRREKPSDYVYTETGVIKSLARISEVTLLANAWIGNESPYSQVVNVNGVTKNSQVDLTPSVEQLEIFYEKDITFVTENDNGVVTVFAIGQKPQNDYTIQVTITEVGYE